MLSNSRLDVLQRTRASAQGVAAKFARFMPAPNSDRSTDVAPIPFNLPLPQSVKPQLIALGVDEVSSQKISVIMMGLALRLRDQLEATVRQMLHRRTHYFQASRYADSLPATFSLIYTQFIEKWVAYLVEDVAPRVLKAQASHGRAAFPPNRRLFNQNAVPTLEKFFEHNAFPSRLEKHELATRCDMDYKQIHVWFQNRRSRCRKDGKVLQRPDTAPSTLKALEDSVVDILLPHLPDEDDDAKEVAENSSCNPTSAGPHASGFNLGPPVHAFPSPYPPVCPYDPFPGEGKRSFAIPWLRRCSSERPPQTTPSDLSDLVAAFAIMSVADDATEIPLSPTQPCPSASLPLGFATPYTRAPHPALIRGPKGCRPCAARTSTSEPRMARSNRGSLSRQRSPFSCSVTRETTAGDPCRFDLLSGSRRPKRTLPRRLPRNPPSCHRDSTPVPTFSNRFPGTLSPRSASSRSDGSTSDPDSPLLTPSFRALPLPATFDLDLSTEACKELATTVPGFDPEDMLDFLSGIPTLQASLP